MRVILLDTNKLIDKKSMGDYMRELLDLPDFFASNLDSLADCLSEVTEDVDFILDGEDILRMIVDDYAYRTVRVISDATYENPHLHLHIK